MATPPFPVPGVSFHLPGTIGETVIKKQTPLLESLQRIKENLENDPQLVRERPNFIEPFAKENDHGAAAPLFQHLRSFLQSTNKSLMIEAPEGGGKSLSLKVFAKQLMGEGGWFPIFVSLPTIKDPVHEVLSETFSLYGIDIYEQDKLREKDVVVIVDAVNEVTFENVSLYVTNSFEEYPRMKAIFLCRRDTVSPDHFMTRGARHQRLLIDPHY